MGKRGRMRVQTGTFSGGAPTFARRGGAHSAKLQFFSREGGAPRGVFSPPAHEGHRPARGDRPTSTRYARIRRFPIFCLHLFTFRLQDVELQCIAYEGFTPRVFTPIYTQSFETEGVVCEVFTLRPGLHRFRLLLPAVVARGRAVRRVKRRVKEKRG